MPALPGFLAQHPELQLSLSSTDRRVDMVREGFDCVLRVGQLSDSSLVARPVGLAAMVNLASPAYLARHGEPMALADLARHQLVHYASTRGWTFRHPEKAGESLVLKVAGTLECNDGAVLHEWALAGKGLAWRSMWEVGAQIASGELCTVLDDYAAPGNDIYAVFAQRRHLPLRIRTFVEFLRRSYSQPEYWRI